ncbi:hypothetical protein CAPTEDRAFT_228404 [Capitella teleta]|uniref:IgGFc-binding protein N-terminal domain-containing protein n=1 Tax=Capitella teleta TaxID=283909 RepID=R7UTU2_CAPTE|nr:hypothetical protein CAPTEDRAFT_228404 [Capitella teleta]|eukprot:ELU07357.1 hypothetical protein CAPTEDRAFT_228404 [Capitella teleta]
MAGAAIHDSVSDPEPNRRSSVLPNKSRFCGSFGGEKNVVAWKNTRNRRSVVPLETQGSNISAGNIAEELDEINTSGCLLVIAERCASSTSASADDGSAKRGRIFFVCFTENRLLVDHPRPRLYITSLENTRIIVSIRIPLIDKYPDVFLELLPGRSVIHDLDVELNLAGSDTEDKGVLVEASGYISVQGASINTLSTDGYMAFPMNSLKHDYYIMSYMFNKQSQNKQGLSQFAIVAIKDFTVVEITLPRADIEIINSNWHFENNKTRVTLNFCQTLQMQSYRDLTATRIKATSPVAVFAGDVWISIGAEHMGDHIVEQMPPTNSWGTEFISAPITSREQGDVYRVLARMDNTKLKIYKQTALKLNRLYDLIGLQRSEFHEFDVGSSETLVLVSNRPVLVAQFCKSNEADGNRQSDSFMTLVPPTTHYLDEYSYQTLTSLYDDFNHYVNLIVLTKDLNDVRLDHNPVPPSVIIKDWTEIWLTSYSYATLHVSAGYHRIYSPSSFSATAYGMKFQESYGFLLGQSLVSLPYECTETDMGQADFFDNDCDGVFDEEIANGIDDDGDSLIDEDVFNEFRARDQVEDPGEDSSALEEYSNPDYYDNTEVEFIDNFEDKEALTMAAEVHTTQSETTPSISPKRTEPASHTVTTRVFPRGTSVQRPPPPPPPPEQIQEVKTVRMEETYTSVKISMSTIHHDVVNIEMTTAEPDLKEEKRDLTMFIVIPICIILGIPAFCCVCLFGKDCGRKIKEEGRPEKETRKAKKLPRHNKVEDTPLQEVNKSEIKPIVPFFIVRSEHELTGMHPRPLTVHRQGAIAEESTAVTTPVPRKSPTSKNSTASSGASSPASNGSTHSLVPSALKRIAKKKSKAVIIG